MLPEHEVRQTMLRCLTQCQQLCQGITPHGEGSLAEEDCMTHTLLTYLQQLSEWVVLHAACPSGTALSLDRTACTPTSEALAPLRSLKQQVGLAGCP